MARKQAEVPMEEKVAAAARDAVNKVEGLNQLSDAEYKEAVRNGLNSILEGLGHSRGHKTHHHKAQEDKKE